MSTSATDLWFITGAVYTPLKNSKETYNSYGNLYYCFVPGSNYVCKYTSHDGEWAFLQDQRSSYASAYWAHDVNDFKLVSLPKKPPKFWSWLKGLFS